MKQFLEYSAWPMKQLLPYSFLHIIILLLGFLLVLACAWKMRHITLHQHKILLFLLALILIISEIYKQLFHFYIMDNEQYNVWIFPFQLCSLPMYICLFLPFIHDSRILTSIETFLMDFNLLGGIMALLFPYDLMQPYITMTIHAFIWHFILVFIGFYIGFSQHGDTSIKGYFKSLPLLCICIFFAQIFNMLFHTYGEINMFYISPYVLTSQPIFSSIAERMGSIAGIFIYISCMCLGAFLIHLCFYHYRKHKKNDL